MVRYGLRGVGGVGGGAGGAGAGEGRVFDDFGTMLEGTLWFVEEGVESGGWESECLGEKGDEGVAELGDLREVLFHGNSEPWEILFFWPL